MEKKTTEGVRESSRICWEELEGLARQQIQGWLQRVLEEEVTEFLGRGKGERHRGKVDVPVGYRNGHGKPRRFSMSSGTIAIRRPRMRGLSERFVSRILPLFCRRTREVGELLPQLYLHGLSLGDFDLAMRGLLGQGAPLSPGCSVHPSHSAGCRSDRIQTWSARSEHPLQL